MWVRFCKLLLLVLDNKAAGKKLLLLVVEAIASGIEFDFLTPPSLVLDNNTT